MSIKNKFATAVATASLLAGLFGSAFVPSAMAGIVGSDDAVVAKYTKLAAGNDVHRTSATSKVFGFQVATGGAANNFVTMDLFSDGAAGRGTEGFNFHAEGNVDVPLKAVSSSSSILVGWAYDSTDAEDPAAVACNAGTMAYTVSQTAYDIDDLNSTIDDTINVVTDAVTDAATYKLCFDTKTATTAATSTITVTVGGVVATTFTVTAVGPVASLTAAIGPKGKYVAEGNDYVNNFFTIIAKDANGTQINGKSSSVSNEDVEIDDWDGNPENVQGDMVAPFDSASYGDLSEKYGADNAEIYYDLDDDTCYEESGSGEGDGDAGASYAVKFMVDDVVSNAVTITCTLNSEGARVTAVTPEAVSGARAYNEPSNGDTYRQSDDLLGLFATVVDADGKPLGNGANYVDFDWEFTSGDELLDYTTGFESYDNNVIDGTRRVTNGQFMLGTLSPDVARDGQFSYTITANDSDKAISAVDDAVAKDFKLKYTVGQSGLVLTRVRNAAKTIATFTADMGEDAAFDIVTFWVEFPTGATKKYDRFTNGEGVAKFVLARRNMKVTVYAESTGFSNAVYATFK